jgi:hypothetical protein
MSCLATFIVTCRPSVTAHELSAFNDAQESPCIGEHCRLSPSVLGSDFAGACLPFTTRSTTMTVTTLVSTTKTLVTTLDGEATSSELTLQPLSSSSDSTTGLGNQQNDPHKRLSTTTSDPSTRVAGQDTLSEAPCIESYGLGSSSVHPSASSIAQGSAARPPPVSGTALLPTVTCGSNASCVREATTTGTSWNWILTATPTQPSFQGAHSSRASRTGVGFNLVLVAALLSRALI